MTNLFNDHYVVARTKGQTVFIGHECLLWNLKCDRAGCTMGGRWNGCIGNFGGGSKRRRTCTSCGRIDTGDAAEVFAGVDDLLFYAGAFRIEKNNMDCVLHRRESQTSQ
eukprot:scaffold24202_cov147-Cylindrotheca_fusiformis.AAC.1